MTARWLHVVIDQANDVATVNGPYARELLFEAGAHRPQWSHVHGAWVTNFKVACDLLAVAQLERQPVSYREACLRGEP